MKTLRNFPLYLLHTCFIVILLTLSNCNEDKYLKEIPKDFYSPEIAYVTYSDFDAAVLNLHNLVRDNFIYQNDNAVRTFLGLSGLTYPATDYAPDYAVVSILLPTNTSIVYDRAWGPCYRIIYDANVIIGRADSKESELTSEQKNKIKAEALFFRAWAHKVLANLYGGVPIVLEETKEPKRDYVRASRTAVYEQCVADLKFAVDNLPDITEIVDVSRLSNLAASHLLSELYVTLGRWDEAIAAASFVIDNPETSLMTERFGNKVEHPENLGFNKDPNFDGGDVYWDLFFLGNQSRASGNKEAILVMPQAYNVPGGGDGGPGVRCQVSRLWQMEVKNSNGKAIKMIPDPNENYGGRGGGFTRPSPYFSKTLWAKSGPGDIRNAPHNIIRDWIVRNPASEHNGKWLIADNLPIDLVSFNDTMRNFFPVIAKGSTFGSFPDELLLEDQTVPGAIGATGPCKRNWKDQYVIRLAETYLLRAEAYLGKGDKAMAAADINVVRSRAQAAPVAPGDVDIDYILDERMRELSTETLYLCTTARLGKTAERVRKYFPLLGRTYEDYHNLWPIPYGEIEKNVEAVLEQNPGY